MDPLEFHISDEFKIDDLYNQYDAYSDYQNEVLQGEYYAMDEILCHNSLETFPDFS